MAFDIVVLRPNRPRLGPLAVGTKANVAHDRVERVAVDVFGKLVVIERLARLDGLSKDLQFAVGEGRQEIAEQVDPFGRRLRLVFLDEIHDPGELHCRDRLPQIDIDDAVGGFAELHLDRCRL